MTHTTTVAAPAAAQAAAWAAAVAVSMEAHAKAPRVAARLLVLAWPLASLVGRPLAFPFFVSAGEATFASLSGSGFPLGPLAAAGLGLSALLARLLPLDWPLASSVGRPLPLPVFFAVAS